MPPASKFVAMVLPKYAKIALLGFNVSTLSNDRRPVRRYTDHSRPRANDMNNSGSHANGPSMSWTRGTCGACLSHSEVCQRSPMGQLQKIQNPKGQLSRQGLSVAYRCTPCQMSMSMASMVTAAILPTPVRPPDMSTSYIATAASRKMKMALKIICSRAEPMQMHKKHFQFLDNILPPGFSKFTLTSRQLRSSFCAYRNIRHNKCLKFKVTRRIVGNGKSKIRKNSDHLGS